MKEITRLMIQEYNLRRLKYDFMGYTFEKAEQLSFHHLVIPARSGGKYTRKNGAILRQNTSHDYLHTIENYDYDMFLAITSELINENLLGQLSKENLIAIRDILNCFEREYSGRTTKKGIEIIKPEYVEKRLVLRNEGNYGKTKLAVI